MFNAGIEYIIRVQSEIRLENLKQGRLQLFDFRKIATATSNFDEANKLGQGGFGPVYNVTSGRFAIPCIMSNDHLPHFDVFISFFFGENSKMDRKQP